MRRDKERDSLSMLEKVALMLDSFPSGSALTLAEVCGRTGLPRSTTHRLLTELHSLGWLTRTANTFELGTALFELGERVSISHRLRTAAMPFMQDLFTVTECAVHLAVREQSDVVYVEKLHGHASVELPSTIGGRLPVTCTGVGKAILAFEAPIIQSEVLARPLRRFTPHSITDGTVLARQLDEIRRTGVAVEREEAALGGCCVASPIMLQGRPLAALSVSVSARSFRPELIAPAVRTTTLALSRVLSNTRADKGSIREKE